MQNSGLLDVLLPHFRDATVRVHAAGSGRALEMLKDGIVDLVVSHAPDAEAGYLSAHPRWRYRKLMFNRFIVVGPADDPAEVRGARDAADAFRRIAGGGVPFVSRGDGSGTHEREQLLWREAGTTPPADRLLISGRGMSLALRHAHERRGYTLSDEATFGQMARQVDLVPLYGGDARLLNTYAVVYGPDSEGAAAFAEWLTRGDGRRRIGEYRVGDGGAAFTPWPAGCPDDDVRALPCGPG